MLTTALKRIGNHAANMTYRAVYGHITQAAQRAIEDATSHVAQMVEEETLSIEWQPPEASVSREEIEGLTRKADAEELAARYDVTLTGERLADMKSELIGELC